MEKTYKDEIFIKIEYGSEVQKDVYGKIIEESLSAFSLMFLARHKKNKIIVDIKKQF